MLAFAANSVLCRLALGTGAMDAAGFTLVRLLSGAVVLMTVIGCRRTPPVTVTRGSGLAAWMLLGYAVLFSFAYLSLDAGTGALILFGAVQATMIVVSLIRGDRLNGWEWLGFIVACIGLGYLLLPGAAAPDMAGFVLMALAGAAWGGYTLLGRGASDPLRETGYNFLRAVPWAAGVVLVMLGDLHVSVGGLVYAVLSGAVASGLGYAIWYTALGGLSVMQAAVVQLSVPVIAAAGGVVFLSEPVTLHLVIAGVLVLGGILLVAAGRDRAAEDAVVRR